MRLWGCGPDDDNEVHSMQARQNQSGNAVFEQEQLSQLRIWLWGQPPAIWDNNGNATRGQCILHAGVRREEGMQIPTICAINGSRRGTTQTPDLAWLEVGIRYIEKITCQGFPWLARHNKYWQHSLAGSDFMLVLLASEARLLFSWLRSPQSETSGGRRSGSPSRTCLWRSPAVSRHNIIHAQKQMPSGAAGSGIKRH